jgi:hypothetical protein
MTTTKILDRLIRFAPPLLDANCKPGVGRCILATAVGLDVLRAFDIAAEPRAVHMKLANAQYIAARLRGADPVTAVARGGHLMAPNEGLRSATSWGGHLVIELPTVGKLLDLDHGQFRRPAHGILVEDADLFDWPANTREREFVGVNRARLVITVVEDDYYQLSKDWTEPSRWRPLATTLVRAVRAGRLG